MSVISENNAKKINYLIRRYNLKNALLIVEKFEEVFKQEISITEVSFYLESNVEEDFELESRKQNFNIIY